MDTSPEMLEVESMEGAPNIHGRQTWYTITPDGGKLMVEQLILQQYCSDIVIILLYEQKSSTSNRHIIFLVTSPKNFLISLSFSSILSSRK